MPSKECYLLKAISVRPTIRAFPNESVMGAGLRPAVSVLTGTAFPHAEFLHIIVLAGNLLHVDISGLPHLLVCLLQTHPMSGGQVPAVGEEMAF